ncbi:MAG TPA: HAMP domain-containing sensor histidine kinase [Cyclobacteriaceae bacterium]
MVGAKHEHESITNLLKSIEDLNQEKQQIISIVSHDIKAPLNRIYALVQLLHMSSNTLTAEQQQYLDKIHQIVADGLSMIRNLVDYRNIEYRGITLHLEEINIKAFVQDTVRNFKSLADKKNIKISVDAVEDAFVVSDNQCLGRVADSLISNAIKFSHEGKDVSVTVKNEETYVQVTVKDQARGFTNEDLPKLFTKFQKLSSKPTSGESSTGLGLFVAKQFLDKIGGTIKCTTQEGMGSAFIITLPKKFNN